ncbi:hypothetical protein ACK32N_07750 [Aeromonas caviae]
MFIMDLSIALHTPAHVIRSWPVELIDEYRAYNVIKPFTKHVDQLIQAKQVEYIRNQNVTKEKDWVGVDELFPFLKQELPRAFEHEDVKEYKDAIKHFSMLHPEAREEILDEMRGRVLEEHRKGTESDTYVIRALSKLINDNKQIKGE